jgi:hypothetical protein
MFSGGIRTVRLLAVVLPVNMLWVCFACTLQCLALAEASRLGRQDAEAACCRAEADAACEAELAVSDRADHRCPINPAQLGVVSSSDDRVRQTVVGTVVPATLLTLEPGRAPFDWVAASAKPPPLPPPLDRLPLLLI